MATLHTSSNATTASGHSKTRRRPTVQPGVKAILHSARANLYYLEHCKVVVAGGCVEYLTRDGSDGAAWNIPIANTTFLLLGPGTSITSSAIGNLAAAGVCVGFCGGDGTPLSAATEPGATLTWATPRADYRPTEYAQAWLERWPDADWRLDAAKRFQTARVARVQATWARLARGGDFHVDLHRLTSAARGARNSFANANDVPALLSAEATWTRTLYKLAAGAVSYGPFSRVRGVDAKDPANRLLNIGNLFAYGLAATALWVLGIPNGFPLFHGKTRRGGLVFDVADLVKDATVLPLAFVMGARGDDDATLRAFRDTCKRQLLDPPNALAFMFDTVKGVLGNASEQQADVPCT